LKNNRKEEELDNLFEKENEVYRDKLEKEWSYQYNNYQQYFVLYLEKAFNTTLLCTLLGKILTTVLPNFHIVIYLVISLRN